MEHEYPTDGKKQDKYGRKLPSLARKDIAMRRFEENVDQESLETFLEHSPDEKMNLFLAMLRDPAYQSVTFSTVARKAGVTLHELQELYTSGMRQLALIRMSNSLPEIMEDVANDARNTTVACTRCDGNGIVPDGQNATKTCPTCNGEQVVKRMGDKHARDLVFESAKLTKQGGGPVVAIQQTFNVNDSRMESMLKRTRQIVLEPSKSENIDNK